jgi:hypothetical protein
MSNLKRIMGTGAVATVLFAGSITVINQPTPALSQTVQSTLIATGSTPVGTTAWQQYSDGQSIFVDVDTSSGGFTTTPIYITSLGGFGSHWATTGATSIYAATPTGFRVYIRFEYTGPGSLPALTPAVANQYGWHINWIAVPH